MYKEGHIAITAVWFGPIALFKVTETFNSKVRIGIDLATSLTFQVDSVSDFDCLTLAVISVCVMSIFLLAPL